MYITLLTGDLDMKSRLLAVLGIIVSWMILDYLFHGVLLMADYTATASLWRPMTEFKTGIMQLVGVVTAFAFVVIFCNLVSNKTMKKAVKLGTLVGLIVGTLQANGYSYMPITTTIAVGWFFANFVKFTVAGAITGFFVKTDLEK